MGVEGSNDHKPEPPKSAETKQIEEESEQLGIFAGIGCGGTLVGLLLIMVISVITHVSATDPRMLYILPFAITLVAGLLYLRLQRRGLLVLAAWGFFMFLAIVVWWIPSK